MKQTQGKSLSWFSKEKETSHWLLNSNKSNIWSFLAIFYRVFVYAWSVLGLRFGLLILFYLSNGIFRSQAAQTEQCSDSRRLCSDWPSTALLKEQNIQLVIHWTTTEQRNNWYCLTIRYWMFVHEWSVLDESLDYLYCLLSNGIFRSQSRGRLSRS